MSTVRQEKLRRLQSGWTPTAESLQSFENATELQISFSKEIGAKLEYDEFEKLLSSSARNEWNFEEYEFRHKKEAKHVKVRKKSATKRPYTWP